VRFWTSLCDTIKALVHIHKPVDVQNTTPGPQILQGFVAYYTSRMLANFYRWHQDVKPQNILVKSNNSDSPYNWTFILSDLGLTHFKRTTSQESSDIDVYGTQTYGKCSRLNMLELVRSNIISKVPLNVTGKTNFSKTVLCLSSKTLTYGPLDVYSAKQPCGSFMVCPASRNFGLVERGLLLKIRTPRMAIGSTTVAVRFFQSFWRLSTGLISIFECQIMSRKTYLRSWLKAC
jgi:hypothetical protein